MTPDGRRCILQQASAECASCNTNPAVLPAPAGEFRGASDHLTLAVGSPTGQTFYISYRSSRPCFSSDGRRPGICSGSNSQPGWQPGFSNSQPPLKAITALFIKFGVDAFVSNSSGLGHVVSSARMHSPLSAATPVRSCSAAWVLCCSCMRAAQLLRVPGRDGDHLRVGAGVHECSRLQGNTKNSHQAASPLFTHTHCQPFNHQSPVSKRSWPGGKIKISCRPRDLARLHHLPSRLTELDSLLPYVDICQHNILNVHLAFSP